MYKCVFVCIHVYMQTRLHVFLVICIFVFIYIYIYIYMFVFMCGYVYMSTYIPMCRYVCVYLCKCVYAYICFRVYVSCVDACVFVYNLHICYLCFCYEHVCQLKFYLELGFSWCVFENGEYSSKYSPKGNKRRRGNDVLNRGFFLGYPIFRETH